MGSKLNWWVLHYIALISTSSLGLYTYHRAEGLNRPTEPRPIFDEDYETSSAALAIVYDFDLVDGVKNFYHNKFRANIADSSGSSEKRERSLFSSSRKKAQSEFRYIGCYDSWQGSEGRFFGQDYQYNPGSPSSVTVQKCKDLCRVTDASHRLDYVIHVKEHYCACAYWENLYNARVDDKHCFIKCADGDLTCGGNYALSVYCNITFENCTKFEPPPIQHLYEDDARQPEEDGKSSEETSKLKPVQYLACANCTICHGTYYPQFDYLPRNSPEACVQFCKRRIEYWANGDQIRQPTPFAAVGWTKGKLPNRESISSCACLNRTESIEYLQDASADQCAEECPGNDDRICGAKKNFLFSVYMTGVPFEEDASTTTTAVPTTTVEPTSLTVMPTTTYGNGEPTTTTSQSPPITCSPSCSAEDSFGITWTACSGTTAVKNCPSHANGSATWHCLGTGDFDGTSPDYTNCSSVWVKNIKDRVEQSNMTYDTAAVFLETLKANCERAKNQAELDVQYFGHEIKLIFSIVETIVKHKNLSQNIDLPAFENLTSKSVFIGSSILTNKRTWEQLKKVNRSGAVTKLLQALEESMFELTAKALDVRKFNYSSEFNKAEALRLYTGIQNKSDIGNKTFQYEVNDSYIILPNGWANALETEEISFLGMTIDSDHVNQVFPNSISSTGSKAILAGSEKTLNGNLMSFSLTRPTANSSVEFPVQGKGVEIKFQHDVYAWGNGQVRNIRRRLHVGEKPKAVLGSSICVYWDTGLGEWSNTGCKLIKSEEGASYCECSHLTAFAVLMSHHNYVGKDFGLEILTLILCPLSIICLFATIVIFTVVRSTHSQRTTITKNLALCLLIGNALVLLVTDRHYFNMSEAVCTGAAIFTHYVFLSAFMWMLIEGYHLYKMVVYVFDTGSSYMTIYRVLAYGLPLIIVGITGVVGFLKQENAYGGDDFCWLQNSYIWSFNGPIVIVVLTNLVVLFITMRIAYRVQTSPAQMQAARTKSYKTWIKGCFSITILLGVTWIVGFFMMSDSLSSNIAAYFFTILNASQGVLLCIFHCLFNEKVRVAAERKNINIPIWFSTSGTNSSDPSNPSSQGQRARANMRIYLPDVQRQKEENSAFRDTSCVRRNSNFKAKVHQKHSNGSSNGTVSSVDSGRSANSAHNSSSGSTNGSQTHLVEYERRNLRK